MTKKKKISIIIGLTVLVFAVGGFAWYSIQRNMQLNSYKEVIKENLIDFDEIKDSPFLLEPTKAEIANVISESEKLLDEKSLNGEKYKAIENLANRSESLIISSQNEREEIGHAYSSIQENLSLYTQLKNDYFYKDLKDTKKSSYEKTIKDSQTVFDCKDINNYVSTAKSLEKETTEIANHLEELNKNIFSEQINIDETYPYAIRYTDGIFNGYRFALVKKQNSLTPTDILFCESTTTDGPDTADLFVEGSSPIYIYTVKNVETKQISIQTDSGEIQKALVNTQIQFSPKQRETAETRRSGNPGYIFVGKDDDIFIAMEDYNNNPYYVLYHIH